MFKWGLISTTKDETTLRKIQSPVLLRVWLFLKINDWKFTKWHKKAKLRPTANRNFERKTFLEVKITNWIRASWSQQQEVVKQYCLVIRLRKINSCSFAAI